MFAFVAENMTQSMQVLMPLMLRNCLKMEHLKISLLCYLRLMGHKMNHPGVTFWFSQEGCHENTFLSGAWPGIERAALYCAVLLCCHMCSDLKPELERAALCCAVHLCSDLWPELERATLCCAVHLCCHLCSDPRA